MSSLLSEHTHREHPNEEANVLNVPTGALVILKAWHWAQRMGRTPDALAEPRRSGDAAGGSSRKREGKEQVSCLGGL